MHRPPAREGESTAVKGSAVLESDPRPPVPRSERSRWGSQERFVALYDGYLDVVYDRVGGGCKQLVDAIARRLPRRRGIRVLDCAAGTGFPAVDLLAESPRDELVVHCTDADRPMIRKLVANAADRLGITAAEVIERLAPPRTGWTTPASGLDRLVVDWSRLHEIKGRYDYVLCRGNSLVYSSSWAGGDTVATVEDATRHLEEIASKVAPGGHLHIDAPHTTGRVVSFHQRRETTSGPVTVWEQVTPEADHRGWKLSIKSGGEPALFERWSTMLTIEDVSRSLRLLGFERHEPITLEGERPGFGVIVARKPA